MVVLLLLGSKVSNGNGEEAGVGSKETSHGSVHGSETTDDAETSAGLLELTSHGGVLVLELRGGEDEEGDTDNTEDKDERDRSAEQGGGEEEGDDTGERVRILSYHSR